jgi:hypothetical protein
VRCPRLVCVLLFVAVPAAAAARFEGVHASSPARHSSCGLPRSGPLVYHYPVKPFGRQHPIRGDFGDPRTVSGEGELGADTRGTPGSYTFHNGVDIYAATGTPVYPVVSGRARIGYGDEVIVTTADDRRFQYFHIHPAIVPGQQVIAYRTVLGRVLPRWLHVHLSEIDGFRAHNPLDSGHLQPYRDRTVPVVESLEVSRPGGQAMEADRVREVIRLAVYAFDMPSLPVPGAWFGFPVTPAQVAWKLTSTAGRIVVPWRVAADFRHTEPPNRLFWTVYAAGTYQNFPVFGRHLFFKHAGRYRFELAGSGLDTRAFRNGDYVITVAARDECGNVGALRERLRIRNP